MIINFSVKNFGCIKDKVTLSFEATKSNDLEEYYIVEPKKGLRLLKLGLIYGPNASGKTTILKALHFLYHIVVEPLENKTQTLDFTPFLFDEHTPYENTFFWLEFIQDQVKYLYEVELNQRAIIEESLYYYKPNKALVYRRKTEIDKQLTKISFGSKLKINKISKTILEGNTLWNNTVLGGYFKTNFESKEFRNVVDWFRMKLLPNIVTGARELITLVLKENKSIKKDFIKILNKADFNIVNVLFKDKTSDDGIDIDKLNPSFKYHPEYQDFLDIFSKLGKTDIIFTHKVINGKTETNYSLPYEKQSEGTKRFYAFSGLLELLIRGSIIVPIDEIESSLHSDLLEHFLLTFLVNSTESQIIATTHHRELLMKKDILRKDAIWFTEKKPDGSTDLYSLADFDSSIVRDTTSIYNAYKIGKLGAKPNLGDYYIETTNGEKK